MSERLNLYKLDSAEDIDAKATELYATHQEQAAVIDAIESDPRAMKKIEANNSMREREVARLNRIEAGMSSVALANIYGVSPEHPQADGKTIKDRIDLARRNRAINKLRTDEDSVVEQYGRAGAVYSNNIKSAKGYVEANPEIIDIAKQQMEADLKARAKSNADK